MEKFRDIFNNYISSKVDEQIIKIDKISSELNIDSSIWFQEFKKRHLEDYPGDEFLDELLSNFIYFIQNQFEKVLLDYLKPDGKNIYKEPYLSIEYELLYSDKGFYIKKRGRKNFYRKVKKLNIKQKENLLKNKLFSYIVEKTNLKIYSKKDIRFLKLKKINEYKRDNI